MGILKLNVTLGEQMAKLATTERETFLNTKNYGIELQEVDFKEFDRRKTPRIGTYASFVKYIDTVEVQPVLIEINCNTK